MRGAVLALALMVSITASGESIVIDMSPCNRDEDEGIWRRPRCDDYESNSRLIEALDDSDPSTWALLEYRYRATENYSERQRMAAALLRRSANDGAIWDELASAAEIAIRFPRKDEEYTPEFEAWCEARSVDPQEQWEMSFDALIAASADERSRPLLARALTSEDSVLVYAAIQGYGLQDVESELPKIEEALRRWPDQAGQLSLSLYHFDSEEADAMAARYMDEDERETYEELRRARFPNPTDSLIDEDLVDPDLGAQRLRHRAAGRH